MVELESVTQMRDPHCCVTHTLLILQVLPQAYGGQAAMIPIEKAVHARLVSHLERARSSPESEPSEDVPDAEGRLTRAGRYTRKI